MFGTRAGRTARDEACVPDSIPCAQAAPDLPPPALARLRKAMSAEAGMIRDAAGLTRLAAVIDGLEAAHGLSPELAAARLVAVAALNRRESRGGHFRADFPAAGSAARTFIEGLPHLSPMAAE